MADSINPREEPGAGKPHARIREGEAEWLSYSTDPGRRAGPVSQTKCSYFDLKISRVWGALNTAVTVSPRSQPSASSSCSTRTGKRPP